MRIALLVAAAIVVALAWIGVNARLNATAESREDESVRVLVYADHYEIGGHRFEGPLAAQLDRYADAGHKVSIHLSGDPSIVSARVPELPHLMGRPNIRMAWISPPERP
jgi:hypothetical protein